MTGLMGVTGRSVCLCCAGSVVWETVSAKAMLVEVRDCASRPARRLDMGQNSAT
jgi:hypothetical protein